MCVWPWALQETQWNEMITCMDQWSLRDLSTSIHQEAQLTLTVLAHEAQMT